MKLDFLTRFVFNDSAIVEFSSDYKTTLMVEVMDTDDPEDGGRQFHLEPDEIDLFISTLTLYKNRLLSPQKRSQKYE
jgi:hypothetical protein